MHKGIDSPIDCTKHAADIAAAELEFVVRYYRKSTSKWTPLHASELKALRAAGLKAVSVWEAASDTADYFSFTRGVDDGTSAYHQAMQAGQPPQTPIYFAVDYDASESAVIGAINDYFKGVDKGFGAISGDDPAYTPGVYGSGRTCAWLTSHGRATHSWLALSTGWAGYDFDGWNIKQHHKLASLGFDNDEDEAQDDYGGF